jgi:small subunit ribosomal protein S20
MPITEADLAISLLVDIFSVVCYILAIVKKEVKMPRRRQSLKAHRKDKKKHSRNIKVKSRIKKTLKELKSYFTAKKIDEAKKTLIEVISQLAKAAKKGIVHKNTARRKISRLSRRLAKLKA